MSRWVLSLEHKGKEELSKRSVSEVLVLTEHLDFDYAESSHEVSRRSCRSPRCFRAGPQTCAVNAWDVHVQSTASLIADEQLHARRVQTRTRVLQLSLVTPPRIGALATIIPSYVHCPAADSANYRCANPKPSQKKTVGPDACRKTAAAAQLSGAILSILLARDATHRQVLQGTRPHPVHEAVTCRLVHPGQILCRSPECNKAKRGNPELARNRTKRPQLDICTKLTLRCAQDTLLGDSKTTRSSLILPYHGATLCIGRMALMAR